jgi:hypothetical protein
MLVGRCVVRLERKQFLTNIIAEEACSSLTLVRTSVIPICSSNGNWLHAGKVLDATCWQGATRYTKGGYIFL